MAAMLSMSMAACGNNTDDAASGTNAPAAESTAAADAASADPAATDSAPQATLAVEGAADEVDMGKVEGTELKEATSEDNALESSGEIGNFKVSIEDAKVFDYEGSKVIAISYEFESNNSTPTSFDSIMTTEVTQDGNALAPIVVIGVEGLNTNSAMEQVEAGNKVTLQKTFILRDEQTDVNVVVHKYEEPEGASVSKAFSLQ